MFFCQLYIHIFQGRCLGVMLGCLLGMIPLLFLNQEEKQTEENNSDLQKQ